MDIDFDNIDDLSNGLQDLLTALKDAADEVELACEERNDVEREFKRNPCSETAHKRLAAQRSVIAAREARQEADEEFEELWQYEFGMARS